MYNKSQVLFIYLFYYLFIYLFIHLPLVHNIPFANKFQRNRDI